MIKYRMRKATRWNSTTARVDEEEKFEIAPGQSHNDEVNGIIGQLLAEQHMNVHRTNNMPMDNYVSEITQMLDTILPVPTISNFIHRNEIASLIDSIVLDSKLDALEDTAVSNDDVNTEARQNDTLQNLPLLDLEYFNNLRCNLDCSPDVNEQFPLNEQQQDIFVSYLQHVKKLALYNVQPSHYPCPEPYLRVILGGPGAGKSEIAKRLNKRLEQSACFIVSMAPTGVASANIRGLTSHSALNIPVFRDKYDGEKILEPLPPVALQKAKSISIKGQLVYN